MIICLLNWYHPHILTDQWEPRNVFHNISLTISSNQTYTFLSFIPPVSPFLLLNYPVYFCILFNRSTATWGLAGPKGYIYGSYSAVVSSISLSGHKNLLNKSFYHVKKQRQPNANIGVPMNYSNLILLTRPHGAFQARNY